MTSGTEMSPTPADGREGLDDAVLPFAVEALDVRGRIVRLGPSIDTILRRHGYPDPVARLLGEAAALTVLLGSSLKFEGRFQLQTKTDGPVAMIVVDFEAPDRVGPRPASTPGAWRPSAAVRSGPRDSLGHGHLAMTIDQGRRRAATRASWRSRARASRRRRTSISASPSRSRPGSASRWRRNSRTARPITGPAVC